MANSLPRFDRVHALSSVRSLEITLHVPTFVPLWRYMDPLVHDEHPKPRLRGVIHLLAIIPAILAATALFLQAREGVGLGAKVYGVALVALFSFSALYHTPKWSPRVRSILRRLDHSMIFIFIAGSYTPFCMEIGGKALNILLPIIWMGAFIGLIMSIFWVKAPKLIRAVPYLLLGWAAVPAMEDFYMILGPGILALIAVGGLMYTLGAVAYARKSPDPAPFIFGYHEIFHSLVVAAAACHYTAIWITVT